MLPTFIEVFGVWDIVKIVWQNYPREEDVANCQVTDEHVRNASHFLLLDHRENDQDIGDDRHYEPHWYKSNEHRLPYSKRHLPVASAVNTVTTDQC